MTPEQHPAVFIPILTCFATLFRFAGMDNRRVRTIPHLYSEVHRAHFRSAR